MLTGPHVSGPVSSQREHAADHQGAVYRLTLLTLGCWLPSHGSAWQHTIRRVQHTTMMVVCSSLHADSDQSHLVSVLHAGCLWVQTQVAAQQAGKADCDAGERPTPARVSPCLRPARWLPSDAGPGSGAAGACSRTTTLQVMSVMEAWMTTTVRIPRSSPQLVRSEGIRLNRMMPMQVTTVPEAMTGRACRHSAMGQRQWDAGTGRVATAACAMTGRGCRHSGKNKGWRATGASLRASG